MWLPIPNSKSAPKQTSLLTRFLHGHSHWAALVRLSTHSKTSGRKAHKAAKSQSFLFFMSVKRLGAATSTLLPLRTGSSGIGLSGSSAGADSRQPVATRFPRTSETRSLSMTRLNISETLFGQCSASARTLETTIKASRLFDWAMTRLIALILVFQRRMIWFLFYKYPTILKPE